jgi:hypothetical protein
MSPVLRSTPSRVRGRGALSLRLGAQTLSRTGRGGRTRHWRRLRRAVRDRRQCCRMGNRAEVEAFNLSRYGRGGEPKRAGEGAEPARAAMPGAAR